MASSVTAVKVFIASPGGLTSERNVFKEVIDRVNLDLALDSGVTFVPRGWEYASASVGRPQEIINQQVRESDYLVVILWDKWGSPPGTGSYSSGTEEEFRVAQECLLDPEMPMRDIVVLFKGVNERQLADPGEDLKRVLEFKSELEGTRELLYKTFDTIDEFRDDFRTHLHQWVRDLKAGPADAAKSRRSEFATTTPLDGPTVDGDPEVPKSLAQSAKAAVDRGRYTSAEQLFAQATTGPYDRESWTEYVRYLRKSSRYSLAQTNAETFLAYAQDADDHLGEVEALANLAIIDRQQGKSTSSLEYLSRALRALDEYLARVPDSDPERLNALATRAFLLDNQSLSLRRLPGRADEALATLNEAREVQDEAGDRRGVGFTLRNRGSLLNRLGRLAEAEEALLQSLAVFTEVEYPAGQATALWSLGELYEAMGDLPRAIDMVDQSVAVSPTRAPGRTANNYAVLSRLHLKQGNLEKAKHYADYAVRTANEVGNPESRATALLADGSVTLALGDVDRGTHQLQDALETFDAVGNRVGMAAARLAIARQRIAAGDEREARRELAIASSLLSEAPHRALSEELAALNEIVGA